VTSDPRRAKTKIRLRKGLVKRRHSLALPSGKSKCLPDTRKGISLCRAARVTLVNRRLQRGKLRLVLLLFALQCAQGGAENLAGVFVPAALDLRQNEAVKLVSQIHIARCRDFTSPNGGVPIRSG